VARRLKALVCILPLGLLSTVFAVFLLTDAPTSFSRGVAVPFSWIFGLALSVMGATVGFRTAAQVAKLEADLTSSPESAVANELERMKKINAAWPVYLSGYTALAVIGLALRFGLRTDAASGVGVALNFFAAVGMLIDGFA
jgi:hypothetical protein